MNAKYLGPGTVLLLLLVTVAPPAQGAAPPGKWFLCRHHIPSPRIETDPQGRIVFQADRGTGERRRLYRLYGDVAVTGDGQRLRADTVVYDSTTQTAEAEGPLRYEKSDLILHGARGRLRLDTEEGTVEAGRFELPEEHGRGEARRIELAGKRRTILLDTRYTTCDPGSEDWLLRARRVVLDHERNVGSAWHAWLRFMKVPVFYFPYVNFPLGDQRKSGFLAPVLGSSNRSGYEWALPYYFNLAPNYDATFTPQYYSKRGLLLGGEFRYLSRWDSGELNLEYIDADREYEDRARGALRFRQRGTPWPKVRSEIQYDYVSDVDYLSDYGRSLGTTTVTHLPQKGSLRYQGETVNAMLLFQSFQTVDPDIPDRSRPYQRLPQFALSYTPAARPNRLRFGFDGELVNFQRQERVSGQRLDLQPSLSLPLANEGAFLTTTLKLDHTAYDLDELAGAQRQPQRTVPLFSLDAGLFLERWYGRLLHTVEPRLFYLYVPRRDQDDIPRFDTGQPEFNFNQLFRGNRFTGRDRVGDANQLSTALTTRLLEENGRERLQFKVGQIFYFEDRRVTLTGTPLTERRSDIVAETQMQVTPALQLLGDLRWDRENETIDKGNVSLRFRPGYRRILNLSYRYRNEILEQSDFSLLWPLHPRWHVLGRWNRDLLNERDLETLAGFEYQNCCWKFNFLARRYLKANTPEEEYSITYYLQIEFKGLASLGKDMDAILERGILGYQK